MSRGLTETYWSYGSPGVGRTVMATGASRKPGTAMYSKIAARAGLSGSVTVADSATEPSGIPSTACASDTVTCTGSASAVSSGVSSMGPSCTKLEQFRNT
ncbi:hypothetical protein WKI68_23990 [Streptomyces sp. MS1.HAVA.3]|uniref:Uncharacterized protein n=1 Tax=Streptomyces caledonius TaxID=3134107 RepID=A0ABU8U6V5_9ACTN